ncbi:hypothetical protein BKH40_04005 [Helicobacter sp. 11S02629-2]|nr:hypothetical protein BKH40_04005 [Helicobacter sp. 11S02629-2]
MTTNQSEKDEGLLTKNEAQNLKPSLYAVIIFNDNYTTMEFVVNMLMMIFDKDKTEANFIMMHIHTKGEGIGGIYPYDIAEYKLQAARDLAREAKEPLVLEIREVS